MWSDFLPLLCVWLQMLHLQEECERRTQSQLQQQATALSKEKAGALLTQRAAFTRELSERMGQQQIQYTQQLKAAAETLKSADENLTGMNLNILCV